MNIIFEEPETHTPTFSMVADGQLFVCEEGCLYQKGCNIDADEESANCAWMVCDEDGAPRGETSIFFPFEKISRIIPKIKRINF